MNKDAMKQMSAAVRGAFDRKVVVGVVIGVAVAASALATAQTGGTNWFSSLFPVTGGTNSGDTALISQQDSVVATSLNSEAADCAQGKDGTIGGAILAAQNVHQQIASATPQVEQLFDAGTSCFNGSLLDLSFAIPSLASILGAVENAVMQYAQKKICTAVNRVTGMVTTPINQAVGTINQSGNLNNIVNKEIGSTMKGIDPALGQEYHPTVPDGTYTMNTKAFSTGQTTFNTSGTTTNPTTTTAPTTTTTTNTTSTSNASSSSFWSSVGNLFN